MKRRPVVSLLGYPSGCDWNLWKDMFRRRKHQFNIIIIYISFWNLLLETQLSEQLFVETRATAVETNQKKNKMNTLVTNIYRQTFPLKYDCLNHQSTFPLHI